jgi:hypothetical protein
LYRQALARHQNNLIAGKEGVGIAVFLISSTYCRRPTPPHSPQSTLDCEERNRRGQRRQQRVRQCAQALWLLSPSSARFPLGLQGLGPLIPLVARAGPHPHSLPDRLEVQRTPSIGR